jgi:hypothetical protein
VGELDSPEDGATIKRGSDLRRPKCRIDVDTEVQRLRRMLIQAMVSPTIPITAGILIPAWRH